MGGYLNFDQPSFWKTANKGYESSWFVCLNRMAVLVYLRSLCCVSSEGIKTIVSFPHLFIVTYNSPDVTLAIDKLDSGTFEHLLGEPLQIMQDSGKGQLIFTSHNLRPLEVLEKSSIIFTTTNRESCYTRCTNLKPGNNLRHCYYRGITLGSDGDKETDRIEIAHAMRKVGRAARKTVEES